MRISLYGKDKRFKSELVIRGVEDIPRTLKDQSKLLLAIMLKELDCG